MKNYDAIIIGFGKGGKTTAGFFAKQGKKVALIEKSNQMYGGTCINEGCIPSKSLIVHSGNTEYAKAVETKEALITKLRKKNYDKLNDLDNVDIYDGVGKFVDNHTVEINGEEQICGEYIFINTGSESVIPPIKGADSKKVYTSASIMKETKLPQRLAIIGGGYIGLEFASMYSRYGSEVTVFEHGERLIKREDEDVASTVQEILEGSGVNFVFNSSVSELKEKGDIISVIYEVEGKEESKIFDGVLLATGRKANTKDLGLENTSVELDQRGNVVVNKYLETGAPNVFALGDVKGGLQFTYVSLDDYRIVKDYIFGKKERSTENRQNIAYSVFITPTFSRVGMSEQEAKAKGHNIKVAKMPTAAIPRANVDGAPQGMLKAVVDADTNKILGCVLICGKSEEMINFVQLAMNQNLDYTAVANHIFTHPSMSESLNDLFGMI